MKQSQRNDEHWRNWSDEWLSLKHSDNDSQYAPNFYQLLRKWDCKAESEWRSQKSRND